MGTAGMRLLVLTAALLQLACGQIDYAKAASTESVKEHIRALYMNMDVPEIGPGDGGGVLNVSLSIGSILKLADHHLDLAFTLDLRWRHKFLDVLVDSMEAIPLNRQKLWTPQFVFVNVQSVTEDQSSLSLKLAGMDPSRRAVVYKVW
uniref:Neur_chan_LBD domain-containing protein n=2 Tax=Macrostomum lignano TaxID=282301 RepID=A0A1I8JEP1_9PLAT